MSDKEKEIIDALTKLRNTIHPMIGHPENPFDEKYLQEMVDLADEYIDTSTVYYAIYDPSTSGCGDYLATGFNFTDKEQVRQGLLDLNEPQMEDEDFETLKKMSLEDICSHFGYELEKDIQPF